VDRGVSPPVFLVPRPPPDTTVVGRPRPTVCLQTGWGALRREGSTPPRWFLRCTAALAGPSARRVITVERVNEHAHLPGKTL
jgi:hypothetical protein